MATYKVTLKITEGKRSEQRRGERETLRYRLLKLLDGSAIRLLDHEGISQATRRSLRIRRTA